MVMSIYAVFDRKTNSVALVKEAENLDAFQRWFATVFLRTDSMFALYPDDYSVYNLCSFDSETLEGEKTWSPSVVCDVAAIFDHFRLARPNLVRDPDEA
jgi:hypothetical protein